MWGCWVLWLLCVLGCICTLVLEDVCVRDFRGLGVFAFGTVDESPDGECIGGRGSVMTDWGRVGGGGKDSSTEWNRSGRKSS
jgi:hypothetical protein